MLCLHDMELETCSYCKSRTGYVGAFWDAKYEQKCAWRGCAAGIKVSDRIRWTTDGTGVQHARHK